MTCFAAMGGGSLCECCASRDEAVWLSGGRSNEWSYAMNEDTIMYYAQMRREQANPTLPTAKEVAAYMEERGAEVWFIQDELYISWPEGTGFYE